MDWLRRTGRAPTAAAGAAVEAVPEPAEGAAPGVAALLQGVSEDRSHAVLDLGSAADASLRVYSRFARWIRFADLLGDGRWPRETGSTGGLLHTALPHADRPYDLIFAWDVLDRLFPEDRPKLVQWLARNTAVNARLHLMTRGSPEAFPRPLRFTLLGVDRIRWQPTDAGRLPPVRLLPADLKNLLAPFQVIHAFTLRSGLREYVAVMPNHP